MSPEKQRSAIAEACGYKNVHRFNKHQEGGPSSTKEGDIVGDFGGITRRYLPDYLGNLNSMHEAEKVIIKTVTEFSEGKWQKYEALLGEIVRRDWRLTGYEEVMVTTVSASAAQRAEAFLRTIGKWEEDG